MIFGNDYALEITEVVRISATGKLLGSSLLTRRASGGLYRPAFASASTTAHIILWSGWEFSVDLDIDACTFSSFASIERSERNLISYSGEPQNNVRVARAGGHEIMAWLEPYARIFASVDGVTLPIAPRTERLRGASSGCGGQRKLPGRLAGVLVRQRDPQRARDAHDPRWPRDRFCSDRPLAGRDETTWRWSAGIAFDGTNFLITWSDLDVFVARLPEDRSIRRLSRSRRFRWAR